MLGGNPKILNLEAKQRHEGTVYETNNFGKLEIIEYRDAHNVLVKFLETGFQKETSMQHIKLGEVQDRLAPTIIGVGINDWEDSVYYDGKRSSFYFTWVNMIRRSNGDNRPFAYKDVTCDTRWLKFSNFLEDIYTIENHDKESWELDKDILVKGNRHYSKNTCCFVPPKVNGMLVSARLRRGKYPVGVSYSRRDNMYQSTTSIDGKRISLGWYKKVEDAFHAYKIGKEAYIKRVADEYKGVIAENVYEALYNWKIEITD